MLTVKLQGGIANTMFQFSMAFTQARRLHVNLRLDTSLLKGSRTYQLDQWKIANFPFVQGSRTTVNENGMPYNEGLINQIKDGDVLTGYWQTEKYFKSNENRLREIFKPIDEEVLQDQINIIESEPESVMVHVRRGDYLIEPYHSFHGVLPISYYTSTMDYIRRSLAVPPRFFVFSDDPEWIRQNITGPDVTIMDVKKEAHAIYLMSKCRHSIIANSSFSWWGAWLGYGKESGIHLAPKQWFANSKEDTRDIIPDTWTLVDVVPAPTKTEAKPKILIAVNSWDEDAKRGCHQAIRETWGKNVAPADLRFFVPKVQEHILLADEVFLDTPRDYDAVCREVIEILRWSLQEGYDYTFLISNDVYLKPQKLFNNGFEGYDYIGFFHEDTPLGQTAAKGYTCTFKTAGGYGIERNLYNWADGGDGRMLSRKAAQAIVSDPEAAAYWFAADDIMIGQILGPHIQDGHIKALNIAKHKDDTPDNGITWHFKSYPEHRDVRYDPKNGWLKKMYEEHK